jgi:hypothetical protein
MDAVKGSAAVADRRRGARTEGFLELFDRLAADRVIPPLR